LIFLRYRLHYNINYKYKSAFKLDEGRAMEKIVISTESDFMGCVFDDYNEIIISQDFDPPIARPDNAILCLDISNNYPVFYREKYLHPSLYYNIYSNTFEQKMNELRVFIKRGNLVFFKLSDNNIPFLCALLALCYQDCESTNVEYVNVTNVPFPFKKSTSIESHPWIWTCYWNNHVINRPEGNEIGDLLDDQRVKFPKYNGREFPVKVISETEEGVTAFTVEVGAGTIKVEPADDTIEFTINYFPETVDTGKILQAELSCSLSENNYSVNAFKLLQFLTIYSCSIKYNGLALQICNKVLDDIKIYTEDNEFIDMPYGMIFRQMDNTEQANIYTAFSKIYQAIYPAVENKDQLIKKHTLLGPQGHRIKIGPGGSYRWEKLQNIDIRFSEIAYDNLKIFTLLENTDEKRTIELTKCLPGFKELLLP
jgi:hypothetical protein